MLWGDNQVDSWESSINDTIRSQEVTHVLAFNEPEQSSQSNISPSDGASLWKSQLEPLKSQGILLGSPAPSSSPSGKQWLLQWLDACQGGCTVDFIAMHYYDINSTAFMEYLEDFHNTFQRPIWVTEWACQVRMPSPMNTLTLFVLTFCLLFLLQNYNNPNEQCSSQDIVNFMNATQQFMDSTNWVERYAWFGVMENMQGVNEVRFLCASFSSR